MSEAESTARPNRGHTHHEVLPPRAAGRSVLDWLCERHRHTGRADWLAELEAGRVTVQGERAKADERLSPGQRLCWHRPPWVEPEAPLQFSVVHQEAELLVVSKPSGLPTLPGGGFQEHTLLHQVRLSHGDAFSPMHRLGRGTSGLVVFARGSTAAGLQEAFRTRAVEKRYRAVVVGAPSVQRITAPIGKVPHAKLGELYAVHPKGKPAVTEVERVDGEVAVVRIETGRPHQIRIHLAHVGHPLKGDPLYGPFGALLDAVPGDGGYQLHAWRLGLSHPVTGARLELEAPAPF